MTVRRVISRNGSLSATCGGRNDTPRVRMRMMLATSVGLALCVLGRAVPAAACSCLPPPPPCDVIRSDAVIFVGTPTTSVPGRDGDVSLTRFHFAVHEHVAGGRSDTVLDVETPSDTGMCGVPFQIGTTYLVYGNTTPRGIQTSLCSRTGPLAARPDDLALLKESAAGRIQPRLSGVVTRFELRLDGFYMHGAEGPGIPSVPITVRGSGGVIETTSDPQGRFTLVNVQPGSYVVESRLPAPYEPLFDRSVSVRVDRCLGEAHIVAAAVPLKGVARNADGSVANEHVMLRVAQIASPGTVSFVRTTLAFTDGNGRWKFPGLPPGQYVLGLNTFDAPSSTTPYPMSWYPKASRVSDAAVINVSDERPQSIEFRLPAPLAAVSLAGRVVDSHGQAARNASISLFDDDDPHAIESWKSAVATVQTDDTGRFTVTGFSGRKYHVQARILSAGGQSGLVPIDATTTPTLTVTPPQR